MDFGIRSKSALVTGGSHGIGAATAFALAREGCRLAICARDIGRVDAVVEELRALGGEAMGFSVDVLDPSAIDRVLTEIKATFGPIDILINNVGGGGRWGHENFEETPDAVWLEVFGKNAMAAVRFTRSAISDMLAQRWGRVVTVASIYGREGGGRPWFNMAKSAEISLMKSLALNPRLARAGVTFNTVAPGAVMIPDTGWEKMKTEDPVGFRNLEESFPLGRMGTPDEVGSLIAFLCSHQAAYINGACIAVDGGESKSF